ncbi:hypothetical protein [Alkalihalobacterium elongatum]|uniref:hypothetical protein n=1 Tax=Alkalihalobacterium elongatum TaxID=2675466 RepID=UPI001C1F2980|nr:hypothetical protein [Alkalihalobacterium elongatum]
MEKFTAYYLNHLLGVLVAKPDFNTLLESYENLKVDLESRDDQGRNIESLDEAFKQAVEHWMFAN